MTEKILSSLEHLIHAINHKATNFGISASLIVTGQVTKEVAKTPDYISLADVGMAGLSFASWLQIVGGIWIIIQILNFFGLKDAVKWIYKKLIGKRHD